MPIKTGGYIFDVFSKVRGCVCLKCGEKRLTLSLRFYRPREGRLRICYRCLAEFYLSVLEGNKMEVKTEDIENTKPFEKPPEPEPIPDPGPQIEPMPSSRPREVIATIAGAEVVAVPEPSEEPVSYIGSGPPQDIEIVDIAETPVVTKAKKAKKKAKKKKTKKEI